MNRQELKEILYLYLAESRDMEYVMAVIDKYCANSSAGALKVVSGELIAEAIKQFLVASDTGEYPMESICAKEHPELYTGSLCWKCGSHTWATDGCGKT